MCGIQQWELKFFSLFIIIVSISLILLVVYEWEPVIVKWTIPIMVLVSILLFGYCCREEYEHRKKIMGANWFSNAQTAVGNATAAIGNAANTVSNYQYNPPQEDSFIKRFTKGAVGMVKYGVDTIKEVANAAPEIMNSVKDVSSTIKSLH